MHGVGLSLVAKRTPAHVLEATEPSIELSPLEAVPAETTERTETTEPPAEPPTADGPVPVVSAVAPQPPGSQPAASGAKPAEIPAKEPVGRRMARWLRRR